MPMTPAEEMLAVLILSGQLQDSSPVYTSGGTIGYALRIPDEILARMPLPTGVEIESYRDEASMETRTCIRVHTGQRPHPRYTGRVTSDFTAARAYTEPEPIALPDQYQPAHRMPYIDPTPPH